MITAENILVRAPNWVGDVVMATPAFRCIRENFADSRITLLIKKNLRCIIDGSPWFDEVVELEPKVRKSKKRLLSSKKAFSSNMEKSLDLIQKLRKEKYDMGFLFPNSFSSAFVLWFGGVAMRVGYKRDFRSFLLTDGIERLSHDGRFQPTYMADYYLKLCSQVGCRIGSKRLELFISRECEARVDELLNKYNINGDPYILINPGASYGSSKCWTSEGFARTADSLREASGCKIVLVCGPDETELANDIGGLSKKGLINLSKESVPLDLLKVLVERCRLLLTVDSGPRHFAVAFNRPVVVLMGPTDHRYTETKYEIGKVIRENVDCSPCHIKTCPTDHRCMTMITPEKVVQACLDLIKMQVYYNLN